MSEDVSIECCVLSGGLLKCSGSNWDDGRYDIVCCRDALLQDEWNFSFLIAPFVCRVCCVVSIIILEFFILGFS